MGDVSRARIAGVVLTELKQITDARGAVLHHLRADSPDFRGFGECYFSEINAGGIKAWKRHHRQTQQLAVPVGRVRFVICDTRADSSTRNLVDVIELGRPDAYRRLTIPPGLWYGFAALSNQAALVVNCADMPHEPGESEAVPLDGFEVVEALGLLRQGVAAP